MLSFVFDPNPYTPQVGDMGQIPTAFFPNYSGPVYILGDGIERAPAVILDVGDEQSVGCRLQYSEDQTIYYFDVSYFEYIVRGFPT